jgi:hypothetical protein
MEKRMTVVCEANEINNAVKEAEKKFDLDFDFVPYLAKRLADDRKATLEAAAERMRSWYNKQGFIFSKDTFYALFTAILRDEED